MLFLIAHGFNKATEIKENLWVFEINQKLGTGMFPGSRVAGSSQPRGPARSNLGNLPADAQEDELRDLFSSVGELLEAAGFGSVVVLVTL